MESKYKYRTVSVAHLNDVHEDILTLERQGKLHDNERYKGYISPDRFALPENFRDARFIIVIARFSPLMLVNFLQHNNKFEVMVPPECYDSGMTNESWTREIEKNIIRQPGYRIEPIERIPLKRLAVRSGLGKYGRNNICYVDEMGSFISLHGFLTDYEFTKDHWHEVEMMDTCESCEICMSECPCGCIREANFVIDAPRCITWYNEKKGEFPEWMDPGIHNALIGCMKCQLYCPENDRAMEFTGRFEDIPEDETRSILNGTIGEDRQKSICKMFGIHDDAELTDCLPILQRNLSFLMK